MSELVGPHVDILFLKIGGRDNALQSCDRESLTSNSAVITN